MKAEEEGDGESGSPLLSASLWARPDGPHRATSAPTDAGSAGLATVSRLASLEQLLIGRGGGGVEARLRLGEGALAGAEIHLRQAPGGIIEATLLTKAESSRQALSQAMDEVAKRLQRRGYLLRIDATSRSTPSHAECAAEDRRERTK